MLIVKGDTTAATMTVEDVVNHGKTCQAVPALPATATAKKAPIYPVMGSVTPKVVAGIYMYEWKAKATQWHEMRISVDPIIGDYHTFDIGDLGIWMIPFDWGKESTSKNLDLKLSWKGFMHAFPDKIWSEFSITQV